MVSVEISTRPQASHPNRQQAVRRRGGPVRCRTPKGVQLTFRVHILARQAELRVCTLGLAHGKDIAHCPKPANRSTQHTQP
jgi:hypothetical protein